MNLKKLIYEDCPIDLLEYYGLTRNKAYETIRRLGLRENDIFRFVLDPANEKSKKILIYVLSVILKLKVVDVIPGNVELAKERFLEKGMRFDVMCTFMDEDGKTHMVNVEISNYGSTNYLAKRSQVYLAKMINFQMNEGNGYESLMDTIHITFCGSVKELKETDDFIHAYTFMNKETKEKMINTESQIVWVELDKIERLERKGIESWSEEEKLIYKIRYDNDEKKRDIIELLDEKVEVFQMMNERRDDYFVDLAESLATVRAHFDRLEAEAEKRELEEIRLENERTREEHKRIIEEYELIQEESARIHKESNRIHEESKKVHEESRKVHEESRKVHEESRKVHEESRKVHEESRKVHEESKKVYEENKKVKEENHAIKQQLLEAKEMLKEEKIKTFLDALKLMNVDFLEAKDKIIQQFNLDEEIAQKYVNISYEKGV